ncbi:hypothetical protein LSAT2_017677 [Lamellibrachia satsuma]|nr:hypothetical protein LSAT2_017677 [Lamellibrachia satsuma]
MAFCRPRRNVPFERYRFCKRHQQPGEPLDQPNTGVSSFEEEKTDLLHNYMPISQDKAETGWMEQYESTSELRNGVDGTLRIHQAALHSRAAMSLGKVCTGGWCQLLSDASSPWWRRDNVVAIGNDLGSILSPVTANTLLHLVEKAIYEQKMLELAQRQRQLTLQLIQHQLRHHATNLQLKNYTEDQRRTAKQTKAANTPVRFRLPHQSPVARWFTLFLSPPDTYRLLVTNRLSADNYPSADRRPTDFSNARCPQKVMPTVGGWRIGMSLSGLTHTSRNVGLGAVCAEADDVVCVKMLKRRKNKNGVPLALFLNNFSSTSTSTTYFCLLLGGAQAINDFSPPDTVLGYWAFHLYSAFDISASTYRHQVFLGFPLFLLP